MHKHIAVLTVVGLLVVTIFFYTPFTNRRDGQPCLVNPAARGTIIILNGISSVGKTSLQKALQEQLEEPYIAVGLDNLVVGGMPSHCLTGEFVGTPRPERGVQGIHGYWHEDEHKGKLFKLEFGPVCMNLVRGMHRSLASLASQQNNLVVDYILYDQRWLPDLVDALYGYRVYFVGVKAPLSIVEQREKKRATSPEGHARAYADVVHQHKEYDIIVDTGRLSPQEAAKRIREYMHEHSEPQTFKHLYNELVK